LEKILNPADMLKDYNIYAHCYYASSLETVRKLLSKIREVSLLDVALESDTELGQDLYRSLEHHLVSQVKDSLRSKDEFLICATLFLLEKHLLYRAIEAAKLILSQHNDSLGWANDYAEAVLAKHTATLIEGEDVELGERSSDVSTESRKSNVIPFRRDRGVTYG